MKGWAEGIKGGRLGPRRTGWSRNLGGIVSYCCKFTIEIDKRSVIVEKLNCKYNYAYLYEESF